MLKVLFCGLVVAAACFGQAGFEAQAPTCGYGFPSPCGTSGDAEGVSWNGIAGQYNGIQLTPTVDTASGAGMPCSGAQYLRMTTANPSGSIIPPGGPIPAGACSEVFIPIPSGASSVSFCWDFYYNDYGGGTFNDAAAIDVVATCGGPSMLSLVYADGNTPGIGMVGAGCDPNDFTEVSPAGPQAITGVVLPAGGAYLRLQASNSGDNGYNGHLAVDDVTFTTGPLPCTLWFSSPLGPGSIQMENLPCPPVGGASYLIGMVLVQGTTPGGWFFGLDIPWNQLVGEFNSGYPFAGTLDGAGYSSFGPIVGAPSGLQLWAVSTQWSPGFGSFLFSRGVTTYTIP